ncbi:CPBP family intramembrane glutamic endopeptidase [Inhella gelatinilytica]|uniref:CPBP family intramembrane metalloprotease n=1 Tax=Inhella gelatinilytica TaxID=2795030 RepID=A0A931NDK3_9BURK|nr:CPBP family intramembrane glutamic endopeptidase [Inhella gelatinilytica]MBH9551541.1 CPBP family intramembrane metalloprotease [Inhella gelatinilytica]
MSPSVPSSVRAWPALFEVLALSLLGGLLAMLLAAAFGVRLSNPLAALQPSALPASWLPLAQSLAQVLLFQYGGIALLVTAIWWPRGDLRQRRLGLGCAGKPLLKLLKLGLLAACLLAPWHLGLLLADAQWDLGPTEPWRQALLDAPQTWDFWVLMAVASYGLVPVLEEIFYRGVLQGRLQQVMPPGLAILLSSLLFALSHSQYHQPNLLNLGTFAFLLATALVLGGLYWRTGSLWPGMLAHGVINLPAQHGAAGLMVMALMVGVAWWGRRILADWVTELLWVLHPRRLGKAAIALALATLSFSLLSAWAAGMALLLALALLPVGLGWDAWLRRGRKNAASN